MSELLTEALAAISAQRSQGWHDVRLGRFTASEIWKLMVEPKTKVAKEAGELSETAKTYIKEKVAETLTGMQHMVYSASTNWGEEYEEQGMIAFSEKTGIKITPVSFIPYGQHSGGSPDAKTDDNGLLELKCPFNSCNMVDYLQLRTQEDLWKLHKDYWWQCQANMLFSGVKHCYFAAYDPRMSEDLKLHYIKLEADEVAHERILSTVEMAVKEKEKIINCILRGVSELTATLEKSIEKEISK